MTHHGILIYNHSLCGQFPSVGLLKMPVSSTLVARDRAGERSKKSHRPAHASNRRFPDEVDLDVPTRAFKSILGVKGRDFR